jgi:predicted dehydrogenase
MVQLAKFKIALVGAGTIGSVHAVALHENPEINFAAVIDVNDTAAQNIAKKYQIPAFKSINDCLQEIDFDAFDICVDEDHHVEVALAAVNAKKHVLLEKPIAKTTEEALKIKEAAEKNGVRLMIAHLLHFDSRYALLLDAVHKGELGEISSIYVKRCNTLATCRRIGGKVSFMYYLAVHDIELLCAYSGGKPEKVYACFPNKICRKYKDDDGIYAIVNFYNGVVGCIEVDWSYQDSMPMPVWSYAKVSGTKGIGIVEINKQGLTMNMKEAYTYPDTMLAPEYNGRMHGAMYDQIDHFVKSIQQKTLFAVNLDTAIDAIRIIDACFQSRETGMPVKVCT